MGDLIPRLYLAGNVSGYCNCGIILGTHNANNSSGIGFGGALAFGRYCVQQMAGNANWTRRNAPPLCQTRTDISLAGVRAGRASPGARPGKARPGVRQTPVRVNGGLAEMRREDGEK